jgi:hypothetical protein
MELPDGRFSWVVGGDAASATVVASDAVVVAKIVVDAGVKCLVRERLGGCRLSSPAAAQATHDHDELAGRARPDPRGRRSTGRRASRTPCLPASGSGDIATGSQS